MGSSGSAGLGLVLFAISTTFYFIFKMIFGKDTFAKDADGNIIGKVTSGTQSPSLQKAIGMAYVQSNLAKEGQEIFIKIRDNKVKAKLVKFPFYKA